MNNEEAIKVLTKCKDKIDDMRFTDTIRYDRKIKTLEALIIAIKALENEESNKTAREKQIPKKPTTDEAEPNGLFCHGCGLQLEESDYYCPLCGQAIDWSDDKEAGEDE